MNMSQATFLAQWQDHCEQISAQAREVVEKSHEIMNRGETAAFQAITRRADRLIEKSAGGLSREAAITRVLSEDPQLYADYQQEFALRQHMSEVTERHHRAKVNKAWDEREALLDSYARSTDEQALFDVSRNQ